MAKRGLLDPSIEGAKRLYDALEPEIKRLIGQGYPESVAQRIASGELDMSPDAIAKRREAYPDQLYHGSMQDIQGEFTAGYGDGLLFFTPDPQFASNWVGKGKMQQRAGELDWHDRFKPQRQKVYDQLGGPEYGTPEYEDFERLTSPIREQEINAFKTVYPVRTRLLNTFDPTAEGAYENITKPIFEKRFGGSIDPETERYLRQGSYMFYEDRDVVRELKKLGYDSMRLSEDSDGKLTTVAKFDPYDIKALGAAFDPEYTGSNILGSRVAPTVATGLIGAGVLMSPQDAEAGVGTKTAQGLIDYIRAYHGSPYKFDRFDSGKIGTGEGNQAYGYGLYFADSEDVAKTYKQAPEVLEGFDNFAMSDAANKYVIDINKNTDNGLIEYATDELLAGDFTPDTIKRKMRELDDDFTQQEIDAAIGEFDKILKDLNDNFSGTMYEVNIKAKPEELLDWDKPLGQQSEVVKKAIQSTRDKLPPNAVDDLGGDLSLLYGDDVSVGDFLGNMQAIGGRPDFGESLMNELGIKGISYADQMSRGADGGTKNYVIFDPRIIDISRQYGITIPGASELLYQMENAPKTSAQQPQFDPVNERVQGLMSAIAPEPGYIYGDILPIKRSEDPTARAEFPYGFEPAIPNVARGLIEELVRAYELNRAGRSQEAAQSAVGALF